MARGLLLALRRTPVQPDQDKRDLGQKKQTEGQTWRPLERTGSKIGADVPSNKQEKGF